MRSRREVASLIACGPVIPIRVKLGENNTKALTKTPARKPSGSVANNTGRVS